MTKDKTGDSNGSASVPAKARADGGSNGSASRRKPVKLWTLLKRKPKRDPIPQLPRVQRDKLEAKMREAVVSGRNVVGKREIDLVLAYMEIAKLILRPSSKTTVPPRHAIDAAAKQLWCARDVLRHGINRKLFRLVLEEDALRREKADLIRRRASQTRSPKLGR